MNKIKLPFLGHLYISFQSLCHCMVSQSPCKISLPIGKYPSKNGRYVDHHYDHDHDYDHGYHQMNNMPVLQATRAREISSENS